MEDIKTYIESGILELYVMGDLSRDERLEVERMASLFPDVKVELTAVERALEGYATSYAIEPKVNLRQRIVQGLETGEPIFHQTQRDALSDNGSAPVVEMPRRNNFYKYAFAASVALLLLSWAGLFSIYSRLQNSRSELLALQASNQKYANRVNYIEKELDGANQSISVLKNPEFKLIKLQGTKNSPASGMLVAFNSKKKEVMIDLSSLKMPENDSNHQYQLWALVDGKPVDLGVFDAATDSTGMVLMKSLDRAQAFAVTLEPRGGSVNPTMDQMMVMGGI